MSIIDQVAELRAELVGSILTKRERAQLEAELREALAALRRATVAGEELASDRLAA